MKRKRKSKEAVKLGSRGGKTRAANLTPERRSEIARLAALTRWKKRKLEVRS